MTSAPFATTAITATTETTATPATPATPATTRTTRTTTANTAKTIGTKGTGTGTTGNTRKHGVELPTVLVAVEIERERLLLAVVKELHEPCRLWKAATTQPEAIEESFACDCLCLLHGLWVRQRAPRTQPAGRPHNTIRGDQGHFCL